MKKSLLALAVLSAFAGAASAQSSVTLYGTLDLSGKYVKNDGSNKRLSLSQDGINSSQLGFRGVEDLGGGLKAGFNLLAGVNADTGTTNVATTPNNAGALLGPTGAPAAPAAGPTAGNAQNNQSKFFNRRSTVSLFSNAGELRLGRDYTSSFWNQTLFDAFGTNGLGNSLNVRQVYNGTRMDNAISYLTPANLGGFYGQAQVAAAEGGSSLDRPARYIGGRVGFAAGPFDVAVSYARERFANSFGFLVPNGVPGNNAFGLFIPGGSTATQNTWNIGGSYDFGVLKLLGYFDHESLEHFSERDYHVSMVIPMGQGEVHLGYNRSNATTGTKSATGAAVSNNVFGPTAKSLVVQYAATYQYNLSKRTAMYGTASLLENRDNTRFSAGGTSVTAAPTAGGKSKGFELGVRHFF
ncbi:MAG: porin [Pseudomonadota bacterium]|nr:porin [Pseudomonadota bacterium]